MDTKKAVSRLNQNIVNELDCHNLCILFKGKKGEIKDKIFVLPPDTCELKYYVNYNKILMAVSKEIDKQTSKRKSKFFKLPPAKFID
jgi:hypothetical protein